MSHALAQLVAWINVGANAVGGVLLAPAAVLPGWLSNTIFAAVTGVVLLVLFKYTSNQRAIGKIRDDMKAHMLALKLFKDSLPVTLKAQGRVFRGAAMLAFHAIRPMLVMIVPVSLLLAQMGLWYQQRPLKVGEYAVITMALPGSADEPLPPVSVKSRPDAAVTVGPVRILSKREVCWEIRAARPGCEPIVFDVAGSEVTKELAVGEGFVPVSVLRPGDDWVDRLLNPREKPFGQDSPVRSIAIAYPQRSSWTSGTDWWVGYFFVASLVFAMIAKPVFGVKL